MPHSRTKAIAALCVALALPAATFSPASAAPTPRAPQEPTYEIATVNGSGCPPGSVTVTPEATGFSVMYTRFTAKVGGTATPTDFRKNCQIALNVTVPEGMTYAVKGVDHRGYAELGPATTGQLKSSFYFSGHAQTGMHTKDIPGPDGNYWLLSYRVPPADLQWIRCYDVARLNLNTEVRLASSDKSQPAIVDVNAEFGTSYYLEWKKACD
ncbi:MAG: DUF4360 domain-containing protein [Spirillospora sp.]